MATTYASIDDATLLGSFTKIDKSVVNHTDGSPLLYKYKDNLKPASDLSQLIKLVLVFIFPLIEELHIQLLGLKQHQKST